MEHLLEHFFLSHLQRFNPYFGIVFVKSSSSSFLKPPSLKDALHNKSSTSASLNPPIYPMYIMKPSLGVLEMEASCLLYFYQYSTIICKFNCL